MINAETESFDVKRTGFRTGHLEPARIVFSITLLAVIAHVQMPPLASAAGQLAESARELYPQQQTWGPLRSGSENISLFVYRDVNRDGNYDRGDRPIENIAVRLYRPDGSDVTRRSNQYGFVNFVNSLTIRGVDIDATGEYRFEVVVPDGWVVSSGNSTQMARFEERPRTRPGIVADRVPASVGIANLLAISGRVAMRNNDGHLDLAQDAVVSMISPSGQPREIAINETGWFSVEATQGKWTLRAKLPGTEFELERQVSVDQAPVRLSTIVLGSDPRRQAPHRVVVNFDTVTEALISKMPAGPAGLEWTNLVVAENQVYPGAGYNNNTVSGRYIGYNSSGYPVTIEREEAFDFAGAYFGVAWPQAEGETLEIRAWRGDQLVGQDAFELSALGPFWFDADYRGINRLELATRHYWQFVIDKPQFGFQD